MVSGRELNRWAIRELVDGDLLRLYAFVVNTGIDRVTLNRHEAAGFVLDELKKRGYSAENVKDFLRKHGLRPRRVGSPSPGLRNALKLFGSPAEILRRGDEYTFHYKLKKGVIEYMLIEELARAGWTPTEIWRATGFGRRRIQRIAKKVREANGE